MGCIIEQYPNTKLWEKLLEIEADILNIIHERLSCTQNSPSLVGTGETIRFSVSIIDNDTGPIPEDNIVAGTYDLIRIRNTIETTIVDDGAFSKRDGFIYIDIDFDTATWDLDDSYMLIPNQDSTAVIDGTTYYLPLAAWSGMILDLSGLETNVNTIITTLGTPAGASIAEDIADIEAKLDNGTWGLAALSADLDALLADVGNASGSALGSLYGILGDPAQTFTTMVGYQGATSLANKLTLARAGYLDNINNANLATIPDISTLSAARIGYLDELAAANIPTDIDDIKAEKLEVNEVIIYPTAEDSSTTALSDDGTSPAYLTAATHTGDTNWTDAWTEDISFEQAGTISVISIYAEVEFGMKTSDAGATATARLQISGDGGGSWVTVTDELTTTSTAYVNKLREGTGTWITAITAGANQLQFKLQHKISDGTKTVSTAMRTSTYFRIAYRKS